MADDHLRKSSKILLHDEMEHLIAASTLDGLGIVVPKELYSPLSVNDLSKLPEYFRTVADPSELFEEARNCTETRLCRYST